jgi:hypothetical protein
MGGGDAQMMARLVVGGRVVQPGEAIWLNPHEEVEGLLFLHALTARPLASEHTVEAFLGGRFLDGIKVMVQRVAARQFLSGEADPALVGAEQHVFAMAH